MRQLSGQDNTFIEIERLGIAQHIASVAIYDQRSAPGEEVRFKQILAHILSRLHLSPIFRSKLLFPPLGLARPYLVEDEHFDLEFHVRHIALPRPGDWRQLCILIARINARPLDLSRPLWEMYVIEGLHNIAHVPPGSFALLMRVHHCVMDGASSVEMMAAIHDVESAPQIVAQAVANAPLPAPSETQILWRAWRQALRRPGQALALSRQLLGGAARKLQSTANRHVPDTRRKVITRFNHSISQHRVIDAVSFDFGDIRAIKNALPGATINDALLAIVAGALHRYLALHGELPDEDLVCGCPVDVRGASDRGIGGNMIGLMGVALRTREADPLIRFRAVHEAAARAKAGASDSTIGLSRELMETVPGSLMALATRLMIATSQGPYNTMLTNVPGPPEQLYFAGARIVEGFGIAPLTPGVGLFHTASSQVMNKQGKITLCFHACRRMLPDPARYRQCIIDSFAELKSATAALAATSAIGGDPPSEAGRASAFAGRRKVRQATKRRKQ